MDEITPLTVRRCLDVPALKDHCDFAVYVWCCVTGNEAPQLGSAKERHCWQMFEHIQASYARVKVRLASTPIDPHLSGDYVPYKFCQLLGRHECLDHLSLPRSRLQLAKFEAIWKGICEDLEWPYLTASARPCMPAPMPSCVLPAQSADANPLHQRPRNASLDEPTRALARVRLVDN